MLVCLGLYLPGLFGLPPTDRDEARFAQASRQMLASGDYVDIRFQSQARYKKPIGIYWLQAASTALLGGGDRGQIWTYRIPSLLSAIAAVLLTAWIGARMFGPNAGVVGAVMLAGCILLGVEARLATTDAALLAMVVLAQAMLATVYVEHRKGGTAGWGPALLFWFAIGVGILVKGPIIVLVSGGTVILLSVVDRRIGWLRGLRPLAGVALALLVTLPWMIAIGLATDWAFYREALHYDLFVKLARVQNSHGAPPGFYLITFWVTFWPFTLFAALAVPWAWRNRQVPEVRFCLAWIAPTWLIMEIVATKLPHYVFPTFPAIALLSAAAATSMPAGALRGQRVARWIGMIGFAVVSVGLAAALVVGPYLLDGAFNVSGLIAATAALALLALVLIMVRTEGPVSRHRLAPAFLLTLGVFYAATFGLLASAHRLWPSVQVAAAMRELAPCPDSRLAAAGYTEPSLVFLVGVTTELGGAVSAAAHLKANPNCAVALVRDRAVPEFLGAFRRAPSPPRLLRVFNAINLGEGKPVELRLYTLSENAGTSAKPLH